MTETALIAAGALILGLVLTELAHTLFWRRFVAKQRERTAQLAQTDNETMEVGRG